MASQRSSKAQPVQNRVRLQPHIRIEAENRIATVDGRNEHAVLQFEWNFTRSNLAKLVGAPFRQT